MRSLLKVIVVLSMILPYCSGVAAIVESFNRPTLLSQALPNANFQSVVPKLLKGSHFQEADYIFVAKETRSQKKVAAVAGANLVEKIPQELRHERFTQLYKGLKIWGGEVILHESLSTEKTVTGTVVKGIEQDLVSVEPVLTDEQAIVIATQYQTDAGCSLTAFALKKAQVTLEIDIDSETQKAHLIYHVRQRGFDGKRWLDLRTFVDAQTGFVLRAWNNTASYQIEGRGGSSWLAYYGQKEQRNNQYQFKKNPSELYEFGPLEVTQEGGVCYLKTYSEAQETRGITTHSFNNQSFSNLVMNMHVPLEQSDLNTMGAVPVDCHFSDGDTLNFEGMTTHVVLHSQLNDGHYFSNQVQNMFDTWFHTYPFRGRVHVLTHLNFVNAIAFPSMSEQEPDQVWIGTGYEPENLVAMSAGMASSDIIAHELGHLVTGRFSNLTYSGQSGGLNEAFSDMTGITFQSFLADHYAWATYQFDVGGQVWMSPPYYLRSMSNPEIDGHSISQLSDYTDGLNVHYSSGVFNKIFYNLAVNQAWGIKKAYHLMLTANMHYWTETTNFNQAVCGLEMASWELGYGNIFEQSGLKMAFKQQGLSCPH